MSMKDVQNGLGIKNMSDFVVIWQLWKKKTYRQWNLKM